MRISDPYAAAKAIWRHLRRVDGYQPFGYDWPTLRATNPRAASVLWQCYRQLEQVA